jgi:DNA polymerase III subunit beta
MLITVSKKQFAEAVHTASRFADKSSATLPVLHSILILAGTDGIKLRATNLETGIDLTVKGEKKTDGVVAIPSHLLGQLASSLIGEGSVTIEHAGDTAVITSGSAKSTIKTLAYEDFPTIPFPETKHSVTISGALLKQLLSSISSCASTSTVRPELSSVLLSVSAGTLTIVATDSFRLVEKKVSLAKSAPQMKILIPAKNAVDVASALPDDEVTLSFDEHQCAVSWSLGKVVTRLTAASYPDYQQIIPKETAATATVLRKDLEMALRRVTIFADSFQKIRFSLEPKQKAIALFARNPDLGESSELVNASISGTPVELSFNHRYISAALALTGAESLTLSAAGVGRPLTIRAAGDSSFLYLVSPMNQ